MWFFYAVSIKRCGDLCVKFIHFSIEYTKNTYFYVLILYDTRTIDTISLHAFKI
jgi:hypothetical protein